LKIFSFNIKNYKSIDELKDYDRIINDVELIIKMKLNLNLYTIFDNAISKFNFNYYYKIVMIFIDNLDIINQYNFSTDHFVTYLINNILNNMKNRKINYNYEKIMIIFYKIKLFSQKVNNNELLFIAIKLLIECEDSSLKQFIIYELNFLKKSKLNDYKLITNYINFDP